MIAACRFDCIIMDLKMPKADGQCLYQKWAEANPSLTRRIIFLTGGTAQAEIKEFLGVTVNPVLSKPFDLADL